MNAWELSESDGAFDGELPPFAVLLEALGDIDAAVDEPEAEAGDATDRDGPDVLLTQDATSARTMEIEGITLSVAIELAVQPDREGTVHVRGSTPTQWTETTVMPAFHKLTMHIAREPHGEE